MIVLGGETPSRAFYCCTLLLVQVPVLPPLTDSILIAESSA